MRSTGAAVDAGFEVKVGWPPPGQLGRSLGRLRVVDFTGRSFFRFDHSLRSRCSVEIGAPSDARLGGFDWMIFLSM